MKTPFLRWIARLMALVLVSAQLAVAAYACPDLQPGSRAALAEAGVLAQADREQAPPSGLSQPTSNCHEATMMQDVETSALCAEHCKTGQQSDRLPAAAITSSAQGGWYLRPALAEPSTAWRHTASRAHALVLSAPPHAIEHCVRRT